MEKGRQIEPGRLRRAQRLLPHVEHLDGQQFRVRGVDEPSYLVDLTYDPPCRCADASYRGMGKMCKHELACRWLAHDEQVLLAAGEMLAKKQSAVSY